jgi:multiple sugar transport system permease protein
MASPTQSLPTRTNPLAGLIGQRESRLIRQSISYIFLTMGALFMLFPVFWMVTAALKPEWQIFANPPIWIPQHWHKVDAGDTVRNLNIWETNDPETGKNVDVIELSVRRFTAVAAVDSMSDLQSVPSDQIGDAKVTRVGDSEINVRRYNGKDVVALARDGDNLVIVELDKIGDIRTLPQDMVRAGDREKVELNDFELDARRVEIDGEALALMTIGPNIQWRTMADADSAHSAVLIFADELGDNELLTLDRTAIEQYTIAGHEGRYILIEEGGWQPTLDIKIMREHAFTVSREAIALEDAPGKFNQALFPVGTVTGPDGTEQQIAIVRDIIYGQTDDLVMVMPVDQLDAVQLVPATSLQRPFAESIDRLTVKTKDFTKPYVKDETINLNLLPGIVGILGDVQEMVLLIPVDAVQSAFATLGEKVDRKTSIQFQWKNVEDALTREIAGANFIDFFRNSIVVTVLAIMGSLLSCTMVAYGFARLRAPGKNILFVLVLATMMMPEFVTMIPVYVIFRDLGMIDSLWPLFLRRWFGTAFLIFLLRQFFSSIPMELEEAAVIDGANRLQVFFRIMVPLITPALATVVIFTFIWTWNDLFRAAIYLNSPKNYTVAIALKKFVGAYEAEFNLLMAASTVVMLPTVLLFFFAQRFFIEGITLTGMKG